jgi:hypothetical protein
MVRPLGFVLAPKLLRRRARRGPGPVGLRSQQEAAGKPGRRPGLHGPERQAAGRRHPGRRPAVQGRPLGPAGGAKPDPTDEVKVNYEGKLVDGTVFDSSYERGVPASFPLQGLVPAWKEALVMMRPGDEWTLYVPPELGYGAQDKGPIPGNSVMIFRIELIDVLPSKIQAPKQRAPA